MNILDALFNCNNKGTKEEMLLTNMKADYLIGSSNGNHISWVNEDQFNVPLSIVTRYIVKGNAIPRPICNDVLMDEFEKGFIKFKFVNLTYTSYSRSEFYGSVLILGYVKEVNTQC